VVKREEQLREQLEKLQRQLVERDQQGGSVLGFLGGVVLGMLVGAVLALIFAPQPGQQTREQLRDTSIELKGRATQAVGQAKEQASPLAAQAQDTLGQVRTRAQSLSGTAKDQAQSITTRFSGPAGEAKDQAQDIVTETTNTAQAKASDTAQAASRAVHEPRDTTQGQ
jgi:gas vesicle protein